MLSVLAFFFFFFLNDPAPPEFSPFPLPAALPISRHSARVQEHDDFGGLVGDRRYADRRGDFLHHGAPGDRRLARARVPRDRAGRGARSEEHTSELQSPCNLVCRLLLEKKKEHTHVSITFTAPPVSVSIIPSDTASRPFNSLFYGQNPAMLSPFFRCDVQLACPQSPSAR